MNCSRLQLTNAFKFYFKYHKNIISVFHKTSFRKKHAMVMIVVAWLFGPIFTVSRIIPTSQVTADGICIQNLSWPSQFWFTFASIIICIVTFFFPFFFILSLYFSIFISLRRRASKGGGTTQGSGTMTKAKENVFKTLVIVTVVFFLCWIWNVSFYFLFSVGVRLDTTAKNYNFSVFMTTINCCINPFWYAAQYREFQIQAKKLLCRPKCDSDQRPIPTVS